MKRLNTLDLNEILDDHKLDTMIKMSLERPISKEWLDIIDRLNDKQINQLSNRVSSLQKNNEEIKNLLISFDEKISEGNKRKFARENVKNIYFGNMSRPEKPKKVEKKNEE